MATVTGTLKFYHTESMNRRLLANQRITRRTDTLQDYQISVLDDVEVVVPILAGNKMLLINATQPVAIKVTGEGEITLVSDSLLFPASVTAVTIKKHILNSNVHIIQC
jgi:hypothetical protein